MSTQLLLAICTQYPAAYILIQTPTPLKLIPDNSLKTTKRREKAYKLLLFLIVLVTGWLNPLVGLTIEVVILIWELLK